MKELHPMIYRGIGEEAAGKRKGEMAGGDGEKLFL